MPVLSRRPRPTVSGKRFARPRPRRSRLFAGLPPLLALCYVLVFADLRAYFRAARPDLDPVKIDTGHAVVHPDFAELPAANASATRPAHAPQPRETPRHFPRIDAPVPRPEIPLPPPRRASQSLTTPEQRPAEHAVTSAHPRQTAAPNSAQAHRSGHAAADAAPAPSVPNRPHPEVVQLAPPPPAPAATSPWPAPPQPITDPAHHLSTSDLRERFGLLPANVTLVDRALVPLLSRHDIRDDPDFRDLAINANLTALHARFAPVARRGWGAVLGGRQARVPADNIYYVRHSGSSKKGYAMYAARHLPSGTILGSYGGELLQTDRLVDGQYAWDAPLMALYDSPSRTWRNVSMALDASRVGNMLRFVNDLGEGSHNVEPVWVPVDNRWTLFYETMRPVAAGAELSIPYGDSYWGATQPSDGPARGSERPAVTRDVTNAGMHVETVQPHEKPRKGFLHTGKYDSVGASLRVDSETILMNKESYVLDGGSERIHPKPAEGNSLDSNLAGPDGQPGIAMLKKVVLRKAYLRRIAPPPGLTESSYRMRDIPSQQERLASLTKSSHITDRSERTDALSADAMSADAMSAQMRSGAHRGTSFSTSTGSHDPHFQDDVYAKVQRQWEPEPPVTLPPMSSQPGQLDWRQPI